MGIQQKAFGDLFEDLFFNLCSRVQGMAITRFPDGCKVVGRNRLVRVKTPCDWILTFGGVTAIIDTKTTEGDTFPFSKIEPHQVLEMLKHDRAGAMAGYVIWFRKSDNMFFVSALAMSQLLNKRGSIKFKDQLWIHLGKSTDFKPKMIFGIN